MRLPRTLEIAALVALWLPVASAAQVSSTEDATAVQDATTVAPEATTLPSHLALIDPNKDFILRYDVRLGVVGRPAYFGSDEYVAAPDFALHFDYARLKGLGEYGSADGSGPPRAVGVRGSLRFIPARDSDDYEDLEGLDDIDAALELGLGLVYRQKYFELFGDVRYGVIGHNGWVGELGADAITFPSDRWEFRVGPRFTYGNDTFTDTYFGITESESVSSGLSAYEPDGGLLGAGVEATARYRFNDLWGIEAGVRADRLLNGAADSPITEMGSADQFRVRLGITRELVLQF